MKRPSSRSSLRVGIAILAAAAVFPFSALAQIVAPTPPGPPPQPTPTPGPQGLLTPKSSIVILDASGQQQLPNVPPNQDVVLAIMVTCGAPPVGVEIVELGVWSFFDANGIWLKGREIANKFDATQGDFVYKCKYRAPQGVPGEYTHFTLLWANARTAEIIDELGAVRPLIVATAGPQGAVSALPEKMPAGSRGASSRDLGYLAAAFSQRPGRDGLKVSMEAQRKDNKVRFLINADRDCEAILLNMASSGQVKVLSAKPLSLSAGKALTFPSGAEGLELSGPKGEERLAVLALAKAADVSADDPTATARKWMTAGCATAAAAVPIEKGAAPLALREKGAALPGAAAPAKPSPGGKESLQKLFDRK